MKKSSQYTIFIKLKNNKQQKFHGKNYSLKHQRNSLFRGEQDSKTFIGSISQK